MNNWANVDFESSTQTTQEFTDFANDYKNHLNSLFKGVGMELVDFNQGHFYVSGFAKNLTTGKIAYFSTDDVRWSKGWLTSVLVRSAKDVKDYKGGTNNFVSLPFVGTLAQKLTI